MAVNTNTICRKSDNSESRQQVGICYATSPSISLQIVASPEMWLTEKNIRQRPLCCILRLCGSHRDDAQRNRTNQTISQRLLQESKMLAEDNEN
jgi:hypothetical protein